MMLTFVWNEISNPEDEVRFITFVGTPTQVQAEANGFVASGIIVRRVIVFGEKNAD